MKCLLTMMLCLMTLTMITPISAFAMDESSSSEPYTVEEELTIGSVKIENNANGINSVTTGYKSRPASKSKKYSKDGDTIANISVTAKFKYNGSSVSVVSKEIIAQNTYKG